MTNFFHSVYTSSYRFAEYYYFSNIGVGNAVSRKSVR